MTVEELKECVKRRKARDLMQEVLEDAAYAKPGARIHNLDTARQVLQLRLALHKITRQENETMGEWHERKPQDHSIAIGSIHELMTLGVTVLGGRERR